MHIEPYKPLHVSAVRAFNTRLANAQVPVQFRLTESANPSWLAPSDSSTLYQEQFLVVDGDEIRGGYVLKHQEFFVGGRNQQVGFYRAPVSQVLADKSFAHVGTVMLRDAMKRSPRLFCLGMGGLSQPLPRMLAAAGWQLDLVPFYFRICNAGQVVRQLPSIRSSSPRRLVLDMLALSGAAQIGFRALHAVKSSAGRRDDIRVVQNDAFPQACDELTDASARVHQFVALRTVAVLERLYPRQEPKFHRLLVYDGNRLLGWAMCVDTRMQNSPHFANLRVGSIIDCDALPTDALEVVRAATRHLARLGVDMIVSNQAAVSWCDAFAAQGYLTGPSNFAIALSKPLAAVVKNSNAWRQTCHLTRGDGDGPIHL